MASFLDLPPEIRQSIYDLLLVDPIKDNNRLVYTVDKLGKPRWSRTTGLVLTRQIEGHFWIVAPSVSHIDYSDLWSLASTNKLLYVEVSPTMCMHAQLEYTSGDLPNAHREPTLLHTYLEKILPTTSSLYRNLTIINGCLSGKETKSFVDLINIRLPNLTSFNIQAVHPAAEGWPIPDLRDLLIRALEITQAARPVARLTSRPVLSIKPQAYFYLRHEPFKINPDNQLFTHLKWPMILGVTQSLVDIRDWRRQAQEYHANACQRGDYLLLTSSLRSTLDEAEETKAMEGLDDEENKLTKQQEILSRITEYRRTKTEQAGTLRRLKLG
jgi:hypothetical protein